METQQAATQDTPTVADKLFDAPTEPKVEQKPEEKVEAKTETTDEKPSEKPAVEEVKYDLKIADGSKLSTEEVDKIVAYAKEQGLSQEAAQKLLDSQNEIVSKFESERMDEFKQTVDEWKTQAQKDPEYGGAEFTRNVELAKRVVSRYGSQEFAQALDESGFGNHPELLRVFVRIGQAMGEDRLVTSATGGGSQKTLEDIFYGNKN
jgi:hypothetical protein